MHDVERILIDESATIRDAIACIDKSAKGIALVVDARRRLRFTVTDGDIRRAVLRRLPMSSNVAEIAKFKVGTSYEQPTSAPVGTLKTELLVLMQQHSVRQLPLIDEDGHVADLVTMDELLPTDVLSVEAVIMAGGKGTRLMPLTADTPKPMLPVGDKPLLEVIIGQIRAAGIHQVNIATHQLKDKITEHFGDGKRFGIDIDYIDEESPLGTAGALGLMVPPIDPILVMNGDVLTRTDFRSMVSYHKKNEADLTVGVRQYDLSVPYGVVECDGPLVKQLREKPIFNFMVNAGIYVVEPAVLSFIPAGRRFDMTDFIQTLMDNGRRVVAFPVIEYWLDIGQHAEYEQAQKDIVEQEWN